MSTNALNLAYGDRRLIERIAKALEHSNQLTIEAERSRTTVTQIFSGQSSDRIITAGDFQTALRELSLEEVLMFLVSCATGRNQMTIEDQVYVDLATSHIQQTWGI